jgi:very-short-patch-repair endonuclease
MPAVYGSDLEKAFAKAWLAHCPGIPAPVTQYSEIGPWVDYLYEVRKKAKPRSRKWRADFCWPDQQIVLEVQGGAFSGGRHTRGAGYQVDLQKSALLIAGGWQFYGFTAGMVRAKDGCWVKLLGQAVEQRSSLPLLARL